MTRTLVLTASLLFAATLVAALVLAALALPLAPASFLLGGLFSATAPAALAAAAADRPTAGTIVYSSPVPPGRDLVLLAGDGEIRLTDGLGIESNPTVSPDGRWLVYAAEADGAVDLWARELADDATPVRLTFGPSLDDAPSVSPDGRLAFASTRDGETAVFTMDFRPGAAEDARRAADSAATNLTPEPGGDFAPVYSPDGGRIAFTTNRVEPGAALGPFDGIPSQRDGSHLWLMADDGSDARPLDEGAGWCGRPLWTPDGRALLFHRALYSPAPPFQMTASRIWRLELGDDGAARGAATAVTPEGVLAVRPLWDGDGELLVFRGGPGAPGPLGAPDLAWTLSRGDEALSDETLAAGLGAVATARGLVVSRPAAASDPRRDAEREVVWFTGSAPFHARELDRRHRLGDATVDTVALRGIFPAPSPDGRRWLTTVHGLTVSTLEGTDRRVSHAGGRPVGFWGTDWSPDGAWLVASRGPGFAPPGAPVAIVRMPADGGPLEVLAEGANNAFPAYSPDGRRLVFRSGRDGDHDVYLMPAAGGDVVQLTDDPATDTMPVFAPDGRRVAFVSTRDEGDHELYLLDLDTGADGAIRPGALRRLTASPGADTHPRFSPDGDWLVFSTARWGYAAERPYFFMPQPFGELAALRLADGHVVRLTHSEWEDGLARWVETPGDVLVELAETTGEGGMESVRRDRARSRVPGAGPRPARD